MTTSPDLDVVVVGAGPTGLLAAAELALAGVAVEVLERRTEPDPTVKAGSINVATAEILDRRGLLPAAQQAQRRMVAEIGRFAADRAGTGATGAWARQRADREDAEFPVSGHFAALLFRPDLVDRQDPGLRAHTAVADATLVPQREVESILGEHAAALGVPVRRGVEVTGLRDDGERVTLQTSDGPVTAGWVVGADGGRSAIRKLAGIGFPGTDAETTGYQAVVDIEGAEQLAPGWTWGPAGVCSYGPIPGRLLTVQFTGPPADRDAPVTLAELQASIRLVSGVEVVLTALHGRATRWTDNARQAESYRRGRVLLAGDAAHVHSPFSGQGLNLGVGDAVNLGWKLAATVRRTAPAGLLDSYHAERHPIGGWVLDWTRAQVALMRGDAKTAQLRAVVGGQLLGTTAGMTRVVALSSGIAQHYLLDGPEPAGVDLAPAEGPPGAQLGRLLGDLRLADGGRLADHAHEGRFVLLDRTAEGSLQQLSAPWQDRLTVVTDPDSASVDGLVGVLVRPDGVVVWVRDETAGSGVSGTPDALDRALRRWAGRPRVAPAGTTGTIPLCEVPDAVGPG